ncbi:hypothetical protein MBH78_01140 [Oceanimonas sp. NS1]|nr:hypothetical protein [Oceanimonas sp. NS1]
MQGLSVNVQAGKAFAPARQQGFVGQAETKAGQQINGGIGPLGGDLPQQPGHHVHTLVIGHRQHMHAGAVAALQGAQVFGN